MTLRLFVAGLVAAAFTLADIQLFACDGCGTTITQRPIRTYRVQYETVYDEVERTAYRVEWDTEVIERPVTVYRNVVETEMRERRYTVRKPVQETNVREERYTVQRPVWETTMVDRSYDRVRYVNETSEREERYRVCRPVTETVEREEQVRVRRPVYETVEREEQVCVMRPVTTMRSQTVQTGSQVVCQPVTQPGRATFRPYFDTGGYALDPATGRYIYRIPRPRIVSRIPDQVVMRPVLQPTYSTVQVPVTEMVRTTEVRRVPETRVRYEDEIQVRRRPVTVTRYVEEERVRKVPVVTTRRVVERVERQVPVRTCRMVTEERVRKVPVTTVRYETEERVEQVPVRVVRRVAEERTVQERRQVCRRVPVTQTYRVPRVVRRVVELDACGNPITMAPSSSSASSTIVEGDVIDRPRIDPNESIETRRVEESDSPSTPTAAEETTISSEDPADQKPRIDVADPVGVDDLEYNDNEFNDDVIDPATIESEVDPNIKTPDLNSPASDRKLRSAERGYSVARLTGVTREVRKLPLRQPEPKPTLRKLSENDFAPMVRIRRPGQSTSRFADEPKPTTSRFRDEPAPEVKPEPRVAASPAVQRSNSPYAIFLISHER